MRYIRYRKPNPQAMKTLVNKGKGDRTTAEYAGALKEVDPNLKVSAPTISRTCNMDEDSNPVSTELLEAIAILAEREGVEGVTLAALIEANGMRTDESDSQLSRQSVYEKRRLYAEQVTNRAKMIIQNEITARNFPFQRLDEYYNWTTLNGYVYQRDRLFPRNYTFGYHVSGMSPCSTWKFALNQMRLPEGSEIAVEGHVGNFINKISAVLASDSFESELYENEKYSFVFVDPNIYRLFLKRLNEHDYRVNGLMTVILLDLKNGEVVTEKQLHRYDDALAPSFFNIPKVTTPYDTTRLIDPLDMINPDDEEVF